MLEQSFDNLNCKNYKMSVQIRSDIDIIWTDVLAYVSKLKFDKKIVFIDPVVLSNFPKFLDLERNKNDMLLVPTNIVEGNKNLESVISLLNIIENHGIGRKNDLICAVGGGALMDTVSMAASIYRRGVKVVKVPTTLLGIVDAAIGIKTGVNFENQRNRLGSYHINYDVLLDVQFLQSLSGNMMRQGLGEIFKIALIKSRDLFVLLEQNKTKLVESSFYQSESGRQIINSSILSMLEELHDNPREDCLMRCVDFGHTFSPLTEMESLRRPGARGVPHGFAVAYDCLLSATISYNRKILPRDDYIRALKLYKYFDFDLSNPVYNDIDLLWASMLEMKKHRGGNQNIPVPSAIGQYVFLQDLSYEELVCAQSNLKSEIL